MKHIRGILHILLLMVLSRFYLFNTLSVGDGLLILYKKLAPITVL